MKLKQTKLPKCNYSLADGKRSAGFYRHFYRDDNVEIVRARQTFLNGTENVTLVGKLQSSRGKSGRENSRLQLLIRLIILTQIYGLDTLKHPVYITP